MIGPPRAYFFIGACSRWCPITENHQKEVVNNINESDHQHLQVTS